MSKGNTKVVMTSISRVSGHLMALDKLNTNSSEDLEQYRYLTGRILACVKEHEKSCKEVASTPYDGIDILLATLESSNDSQLSLNVTHSLLEILNLEKKISVLVSRGTTQIVFSAMGAAYREQPVSESLMKRLHQLLGKIGAKDRKFGVKARLSGVLPITLSLIRTNSGNFEYLLPLLQVMKIYCSNSVNSSNLGKAGGVNSMLRVVATCGKKHHTICKLAIDTLCLLTKSKSNSARALGQGGIPILLSLFYEWHRHDTRNRHIGIRKAILGVIKNITNLKSGRKAFIEADGIKILYGIILDMPSSSTKDLDGIISLISIILRKCFPKNRLPIPTIKSCFHFPIPDGDGGSMLLSDAADDVIDDSDDGDDDVSSIDEPPASKEAIPEEEDESADPSQARTTQDLAMYQEFFMELTDFEEFFQDSPYTEDESSDGYIGTDASEVHHRSSSRVSSILQGNLRENRLSLPNLSLYSNFSATKHGNMEVSDSEIQPIRAPGGKSSRCKSSSRKNGRHKSNEGLATSQKSSGRKQAASKKAAKNSKSSPSLRRSAPSTKSGGAKLSKSLTSLRSLEQASSFKAGAEEYWDRLDALRSSMSISQMTIQSQTESGQLPLGTTENVYPDVDNVSPEFYITTSARTKRVQPFQQIAHPDMLGHVSPKWKEFLYERPVKAQRAFIFQDIDRCIRMESVSDRVVFDLDGMTEKLDKSNYGNLSASLVESTLQSSLCITESDKIPEGPLIFHSLFECGNLRKAVQVRKHEYDLILNSDINSNHHHQWFYFSVSNMKAGVSYRFNIVNFEKLNSQFNFGMQPVMFSVKDALEGQPQWVRVGHDVCYYKNNYARSFAASGSKGKSYYTGAFKMVFPYHNDTVYLAYHYPYTYTTLQVHISQLESSLSEFSQIYYRHDEFCETLSGNPCPLLTLTARPLSYDSEGVTQFRSRQFIFLSARVHPGETNSSWVMKGVLKFLFSLHPAAQHLRELFIFKIVPMLNPDGVINGSHRCSLSGEDLNRKWANPDPDRHPTIYHTKGLLQYMATINRRPLVFCDFHGHSRKKNVFMYGCSAGMSYTPEDMDQYSLTGRDGRKVEDTSYKTLPRILSHLAPAFCLSNCNFVVEKSKDATARVVVWRELGVARSYTMENTYCGLDQGPYKGRQITTEMLEEMGQQFCEGLLKLALRGQSLTPGVVKVPSAGDLEGGKRSGECERSLQTKEDIDSSISDEDNNGVDATSSLHDGLDYSIESASNDHTPRPLGGDKVA